MKDIKYRVKSRHPIQLWKKEDIKKPHYSVQAKFPFLPIWIKVTSPFKDLASAKEYIKLIREVL